MFVISANVVDIMRYSDLETLVCKMDEQEKKPFISPYLSTKKYNLLFSFSISILVVTKLTVNQ